MPAPRLFALLGAVSLILIATVAVPALAGLVVAADALLLGLFWIDLRRAQHSQLDATRHWPTMLVQGSEANLQVVVQNDSGREVEVWLREGLHPALATQPIRQRLTIPRDQETTWTYSLQPRQRGEVLMAPLTARILGPWKLAWSQREILEGENHRVFPQVRWQGKVGHLLALAQRQQLGEMPLRWQGQGTETYGLRSYAPGDPPNKIHWKATARHGRPVSREDTWERGARLTILLDAGRAMTTQARQEASAQRSKLDYSLAAALALTRVAAARGDRVTIVAFSDRIEKLVRVAPGTKGIAQAYEQLYALKARLAEPAFDLVAEQVLALESRSATIALFSSVVDLGAAELLRDALLRLERRHSPLLINLEDPYLEKLTNDLPKTSAQAFAQVSALEIKLANGRLAKNLRRVGVRVVNTPADSLALEALEAYLAIFRGRRLQRPASLARGR